MGKILVFGALAAFVGVAAFWMLNINIWEWGGSWLSTDDPQRAGLSMLAFLGLVGAALYRSTLGTQFGGHGAVRGLIFGVIVSAIMIWVVPICVKAAGMATSHAREVYNGKPGNGQPQQAPGRVFGEAPMIADVKPPLASVTQGSKWTEPDDWQGRVLPFLIGFCIYGVVLGLSLSEDPHKQNF